MNRVLRIVLSLSAPVCCSLSLGEETASDRGKAIFEAEVQPFLNQHCVACHGAEKQKGGLRYDRIEGFREEDAELWTKVYEAISTGEMPPEEEPRPGEEASKSVLTWIESGQADLVRPHVRRLNRRELSASLQDLTGSRVDFGFALPEDGKVSGFDTGADGLQDAADSVAQMLEVTGRAVAPLRFLEPDSVKRWSLDFRDESFKDIRRAFKEYESDGLKSKGGNTRWSEGRGLLLLPRSLREWRDSLEIVVLPPEMQEGVLRVELDVSVWKPERFKGIPNPHLSVEIGGRDLEIREVTAPMDRPETRIYEVSMEELITYKDGYTIRLKNIVEVPYAVKGFENDDRTKPEDKVPGGGGLYRPAYDRKKAEPDDTPAPFIVIEAIRIERGVTRAWGGEDSPESRDAVAEAGENEAFAANLLRDWMSRAYRRPLETGEEEEFLQLFRERRDKGAGFDSSLRDAFQAVLMSAPFRYLGAPPNSSEEVQLHALASRISFMLTGRPPDDELLAAAGDETLAKPAVLEGQVERLIQSPASDGFFDPFVRQWLEMGQPITLVQESIKKIDFVFGRHLKDSMERETVSYVAEVFRQNRPSRELVDSDWTMMNQVLAWHYGYEEIKGSELRKVKLRSDDPRGGGVLGHAGIQSMLTWMGDNWVIYRGAWTLRHILGDPPPPPPLEVPELHAVSGKTFRELLQAHQAEENCAVCHRDMDPLGFAFQNFDLSGRWRDVEHFKYVRNELDGKIEWRGVGETRPVDTKGRLPRGETFSSFGECKQLIATHYQRDMLKGVLKNFVIYGTGRRPDVMDLREIDRLLDESEKNGHTSLNLLKAFVCSPIFDRTTPTR